MESTSNIRRPRSSPQTTARCELANRLESVELWMRRTQRRADDPEAIHQLRVATRRATAALRLFREWLPEQKRGALARRLRQIRRRAAAVRDLDVAAAWQDANSRAIAQVAPQRLREWKQQMGRQRRRALKRLTPVVRRSARRAWRKRAEGLVERWEWRGAGSESVGPRWRKRLVRELRRLPAREAGLPINPAELHEIRKRARSCRYQAELLALCEPGGDAAWKPLLDAMRRLQELLGILQDQTVQRAQWERWLASAELDEREQAALSAMLAQSATGDLAGTRRAARRAVWQIHKAAARFDRH